MLGMLGPEDMGVVLVVAAVVAVFTFGSSKIPQLARSLGEAKNEFKKGLSEHSDEQHSDEGHPDEQRPDVEQSSARADSQNNGSAPQS